MKENNKETKIEKNTLQEAKAKRAKLAHLSEFIPEKNHRDDFRRFFLKKKAGLKLKPEMEEILWKHFIVSGFDKAEKFEEGMIHFGYRE